MYLQDKESMYDLAFDANVTYGQMFQRAEWEWSTYNFEEADVAAHFAAFDHCEAEAKRMLAHKVSSGGSGLPWQTASSALVLPAYDFVVKAAHHFNVLDARGAISVTERQRFIGRVRALARATAEAFIAQREALGFPLLKKPATLAAE